MPQIVINEISQNYTYNIGTNSYATVALPITSCWGDGYFDVSTVSSVTEEQMYQSTKWTRFPATQTGLEAFVAAYRGPAENYRAAKDYSYFMAMTLMSAGYDVLVCRVSPGGIAGDEAGIKVGATASATSGTAVKVYSKYPGTFGNNISCTLTKILKAGTSDVLCWSMVVYVKSSTGTKTAVENLKFVFEDANAEIYPVVGDVESNFIKIVATGATDSNVVITGYDTATLANGRDTASYESAVAAITNTATGTTPGAAKSATDRYVSAGYAASNAYVTAVNSLVSGSALATGVSESKAYATAFREWVFTAACRVYDLLKDRLNYAPNRIISPGWDDQDLRFINDGGFVAITSLVGVSPMHVKLMDVAYYSRCATALLDVPRSLNRSDVWSTGNTVGYAQKLSSYAADHASTLVNIDTELYSTHSALFTAWAQYKYTGTPKLNIAPPAFLALLIQRAMILNQSLQYEWALPVNRKQPIVVTKFDYIIPNDLLNLWQGQDGVGVNIITNLPDLGTTIWGNSTLFDNPPATYQALANLSTRYLMNAVKDVVYRCGIAITFQYNNSQAYESFYAGVTPLLDTMKNVGAIDDYYVTMSADVDAEDQVMANSVIGKIYMVVNGVVNNITVDLIALPPGTDLTQFQ